MIKALFSQLVLCSIIVSLSACGGDKKEDEEPVWKLEARTVGDVVFEDQELASCVRAALEANNDISHPSELTILYCRSRGIVSLVGLEKLNELVSITLNVEDISFDFSQNWNLKSLSLYSYNSELQGSLGLHLNSELESIILHGLKLESLDLSNNEKISKLLLAEMPLKRLNLNTRALERVSIVNTELETLDLSFSERLWDINLASNKLTDIRVDETPSLEFLGLNNNPLSAETIEYLYTLPNTVAVDVLAQHTIDGIYFEDPGLAQCIREEKRFNNHSVFDMQGLNCTRAGIHSLAGVENMLELRTVRLGQNELISLEPLESLANLGLVEAWGNDLKSVDFSRLSNLKSIYLSKNPNLFELKLPQSDLLVLDLSGVGISELDVSAYENLHSLHLGSNSIIKDFVSGYHPKLKDLDFSSDLADGMKLPVFANLESLSTDARLISAQYLAQLKGLKNLFLMNAEEILDDLDLSKNQVLESVRLSGDLSGTLQIENSPNLLYVSLPEEHDLQVIKRVYELQGRMFSDADFFSCIDDHLKALGGSALLSEIKTLDCDGYDIVSLNGIAALSELQSLSLLNTHVSKVDLFYSDNLTEFSISSPILSGIAISGDLLEVFYHCCPVNFHSNFS